MVVIRRVWITLRWLFIFRMVPHKAAYFTAHGSWACSDDLHSQGEVGKSDVSYSLRCARVVGLTLVLLSLAPKEYAPGSPLVLEGHKPRGTDWNPTQRLEPNPD